MIKLSQLNVPLIGIMRRVRIGILIAGLMRVAWVLLPAAFPIHKVVAYPVTADAVSVYAARAETPEPLLLPILKIVGDEFIETGPKVEVYLNYAYDDRLSVPMAQKALKAIMATFVGFLSTFLVDWLYSRRHGRGQRQPDTN